MWVRLKVVNQSDWFGLAWTDEYNELAFRECRLFGFGFVDREMCTSFSIGTVKKS